MTTDNLDKFEIYSRSLRIRMIEQAIAADYHNGEARCPVHLSIGQEANAVLLSMLLSPQDKMVSTHRGHAHYLAKGGSIEGLLGEIYGKITGCARGNGGSMHLCGASVGFLGSTSIVGGTIPVGVGAAWAAKLKGENHKVAVCIGDAAIEEGVFHESANFVSLHNLPVIFFVENNNYSCYTKLSSRQPIRSFQDVANGHALDYFKIKWESFFKDFKTLRERLKAKPYPILVQCEAYRFVQHCGPDNDDNLGYRPSEEIVKYEALDPIINLEKELLENGYLSNEQVEKLRQNIEREISEAFKKVKADPYPDPSELGKYLYV